jgi:thiol:disulfide interchange protein DsbA
MPVAVWDDFAMLQDIYFTIEALGLVGDLHLKVFDALQRERERFEEEEQIGDFVASHGIDRARFLSVLNSDDVATKSLEARRLAHDLQVSGC